MDPGTVVDGRFTIERAVAEGGMGAVYLARDGQSGRAVALKVVRDPSPELNDRFLREVEILRGLAHPAIVEYVAHGTLGTEPYLAMEWLEGEDLASRLARGSLDVTDALALARRIAAALAATHGRGLVHRDLKPSNVYLPGGDVAQAKLLDFGTARPIRPRHALTQTGMLVGTPFYMAPEQARGQREIDARADVFAFGCLLHECVAGAPPWTGLDLLAVLAKILLEPAAPLRTLRPDVPSWLERLVLRMLAKDRDARPDGGEAVLAELEAGEPDRRRASEMPPSLIGRDEQRVYCIILAGHADAETATVAVGKQDSLGALLRARLSGFAARVEVLAGDAALVVVQGSRVATDQALEAARIALALRPVLGATPLVVVTGRGSATGAVPVGEVVERASALLSRAPPGAIVLDETTSELVAARFEVREIDGRRELVGERERPATVRTVLGRPTPFVGRDRELAQLEALAEEAFDEGAPRAALVTGPAGLGKTRLLNEVLARVTAKREPAILFARAEIGSKDAPFALVGAALRDRAGFAAGDARAAERFCDVLGADLGDDARSDTIELLAEIARVPLANESEELRAARRDPVLMGARLQEAFVSFVEALTRRAPLVMVLDDLHWADAASLKLIDAALGALDRSPWLVLAMARPEIADEHPRLWADRGLSWVRLARLGRAAAERIAREILGDRATEATLARVIERADGNAFFLEELVRAVSQGAGDALPDTVLATVQARLDGLSAYGRRALRMASIFGERFHPDGVAHLLAAEVAPAPLAASTVRMTAPGVDWVTELVAAEVVERARKGAPGEIVFRHALVRDAAYETLTRDDRELGHRLAGEWLEARGGAEPSLLAAHFESGGAPERAREHYVVAAERAVEAHELGQSEGWASRALALGAEGSLRGAAELVRAVVSCTAGRPAEAFERGQAAAQALDEGSARWFRAVGEILAAAGRVNDPLGLTAWIQRARAAEARDPEAKRARLVALCRAVVPLGNMGHAANVASLLSYLEAEQAKLGQLDLLSRAQLVEARGVMCLSEGRPWDGVPLFQEAERLYGLAHDYRDQALAGVGAAWLLTQVGRVDEADAALALARATAQKTQGEHALTWALAVEAAVCVRRGDLAVARELYLEVRARYKKTRNARQEGWALIELSGVELSRGDAGAAEAHARAALEVVRHMVPLRVCALGAIAQALVRQGRAEEAVAVAREAETVMAPLRGLPLGEAHVRLALVDALRSAGDTEGAREAAARAVTRIEERAAAIDAPERGAFLALAEHAATYAAARELGVVGAP
ncbi:MAG: protein kinase [Myxococcales bacterium]|nr:protein kinase [Myxococcales bacterium]